MAQGTTGDLTDRIVRVSEDLLAGYAQPLVDVFGTGISTGLFHSAYSHDFLGFDLGVSLMYIKIPSSARYFNGTALICSLAIDSMINLIEYEVELESLSTIFGPWDTTIVPTDGNALAIPPIIPGGFSLSGVPLIMPQLNVGFVFGSEIAIRYVPYTFKGAKMQFIGCGIKQQLNRLPPLSLARLPFAIAIAGAYQKFKVRTAGGETIVSSKTWNVQAIVSTRIGVIEPMVAFSMENTTADFEYTFEYDIPDTLYGIPLESITISEDISLHFRSPKCYRTIIGLTLHAGLLFMHYDYNITPYSTHNLTLGFTWR
jgi:hypothetical protein